MPSFWIHYYLAYFATHECVEASLEEKKKTNETTVIVEIGYSRGWCVLKSDIL